LIKEPRNYPTAENNSAHGGEGVFSYLELFG